MFEYLLSTFVGRISASVIRHLCDALLDYAMANPTYKTTYLTHYPYLMRYLEFILIVIVVVAANFGCSSNVSNIQRLKVPSGFKIEMYATGLENARTLVLGDKGTIFVGTRSAGKIYAIQNKTNIVIAEDLNMPNGLAFYKGSLYVADVDRIFRYDNIEQNLTKPPQAVLIRDDLPTDSDHGWRYIAIGPDERLYISLGAPCNICKEGDYAQIRSMKLDGTDERIEAKGIRNSVGFTWHPQTKKLWLTDNGRDWLSDDTPPDEINKIDYRGQHFGFPYCHGGVIQDTEFNQKSCSEFSPPILPLGAHVAPLGIMFYSGAMFPKQYQNQLFVAEHGSWNRSEKAGYRVMLGRLTGEKVQYEPFVTGWLQGESAWGRPAYLLVLPDGSMLISDDQSGVIYRVSYSANKVE